MLASLQVKAANTTRDLDKFTREFSEIDKTRLNRAWVHISTNLDGVLRNMLATLALKPQHNLLGSFGLSRNTYHILSISTETKRKFDSALLPFCS